jgi:hypothetical protein
LVASALASAAFAQGAIAGDVAKPDGSPIDSKTWTGFGWGLGIAADFDIGGQRVTGSPQIVNGIVRVDDVSNNVGVGFVLEAHYFFAEWNTGLPPYSKSCGTKQYAYNCNNIAIGPYVAVEIGGGGSATTNPGPITGYSLEMMVGLHHPDAPSTSSWNFGIGLRVDPKAQVLGDGFVANQLPPAGETAVRLKTEPRYGIMLLSSFSF